MATRLNFLFKYFAMTKICLVQMTASLFHGGRCWLSDPDHPNYIAGSKQVSHCPSLCLSPFLHLSLSVALSLFFSLFYIAGSKQVSRSPSLSLILLFSVSLSLSLFLSLPLYLSFSLSLALFIYLFLSPLALYLFSTLFLTHCNFKIIISRHCSNIIAPTYLPIITIYKFLVLIYIYTYIYIYI